MIIKWLDFVAALFVVLAVALGAAVVVELSLQWWQRRAGRKCSAEGDSTSRES
jgi:hypothetical protein